MLCQEAERRLVGRRQQRHYALQLVDLRVFARQRRRCHKAIVQLAGKERVRQLGKKTLQQRGQDVGINTVQWRLTEEK